MSVTTDVAIANLALARLGQDAITSLDTSSRDAKICTRYFDQNREYCLSLYNWTSVTKKKHMDLAGLCAVTAASANSPPSVDCTSHTFVTGDLVTFDSIEGMTQLNGGRYVVRSYTSTTIHLNNTDGTSLDASAYTAYTAGGWAYRDAGNDWDYLYDLPSNCLRVINLLDEDFGHYDTYTWKRQRDMLYCNMDYAAVEYIYNETDVSAYDPQLVELIAARLAWLICPKITSDETLKREVYQDWVTVSAQARLANAKGRQSIPAPEALWSKAR